MREEGWLTSLVKEMSNQETKKLTGKGGKLSLEAGARKKKENEKEGVLPRNFKSSFARPLFYVDSQDRQGCRNALILTLILGNMDPDLTDVRWNLLLQRSRGVPFDDPEQMKEAVACLSLATGYGCEGLEGFEKKKPLGFINQQGGKVFQNFYGEWTYKILNTQVKFNANLPSVPEITQKPPEGINSRNLGYFGKHHIMSGGDSNKQINNFMNLLLRIDGLSYPIQAILSLQAYKDVFQPIIEDYPELKSLSSELTKHIEAGSFYDVDRIPARTCLLIDDLGQGSGVKEEIEITPLHSASFLESFFRGYNAQPFIGEQDRNSVHTCIVGDGKPQNLGCFSSHLGGKLHHVMQGDIVTPGKIKINHALNRLFQSKVVGNNRIKSMDRKKHESEPKQRYREGRKETTLDPLAVAYCDYARNLSEKILSKVYYIGGKVNYSCDKKLLKASTDDKEKMFESEKYFRSEEDFLAALNLMPNSELLKYLASQLIKWDPKELVPILVNLAYDNLYPGPPAGDSPPNAEEERADKAFLEERFWEYCKTKG